MRKKKIASNQQLAREFQVDLTALEPMLSWWQRRGVLQASVKKACQAVCVQCSPVVVYEFVEVPDGR
jgi:hypothetical protein